MSERTSQRSLDTVEVETVRGHEGERVLERPNGRSTPWKSRQPEAVADLRERVGPRSQRSLDTVEVETGGSHRRSLAVGCPNGRSTPWKSRPPFPLTSLPDWLVPTVARHRGSRDMSPPPAPSRSRVRSQRSLDTVEVETYEGTSTRDRSRRSQRSLDTVEVETGLTGHSRNPNELSQRSLDTVEVETAAS